MMKGKVVILSRDVGKFKAFVAFGPYQRHEYAMHLGPLG